jgi:hypothetical protein
MVKRKASAETRGSAEKGKEKDYTEVAESTEFTEKRNPSVPGRAILRQVPVVASRLLGDKLG